MAALELVALLSHVRDLAQASRAFQRLLNSVAQEFRASTLSRNPSGHPCEDRLSHASSTSASARVRTASDRSRSTDDGGSCDRATGQLGTDARLIHSGAGPDRQTPRSGSGLSDRSTRVGSRVGSRQGSGHSGGLGAEQPRVSAALRTRLLRHLLKGPTIKLLCAAAGLQQAAPAYNCSVQERTVAMLRTWAFCAPDIAKELVANPYLLCRCWSLLPCSVLRASAAALRLMALIEGCYASPYSIECPGAVHGVIVRCYRSVLLFGVIVRCSAGPDAS